MSQRLDKALDELKARLKSFANDAPTSELATLMRTRGPQAFNHLDDPDLFDRLTPTVECDDDEIAPEPKRQRKRRPSLAAALRQAAATGVTVNGATVKPDGSVALTFGERDDTATNGNPWDEVLANVAH
jgi:hypothetical protein